MSMPARVALALAALACLAGCQAPRANTPSAVVTSSPRQKVVPVQRLEHAVIVGRSTRADVIAALGETLVISFDNGYEVWLYRPAADKRAEFVILYSPQGVVTKTRLREGGAASLR